jgi:choice-of-anchor B domain-containing protein
MKKIFLFLILLNSLLITAQITCSGGIIDQAGTANDYPCDDFDLQSYLSLGDLGATSGNDSWGWTDTDGNGHEYALVGVNNGTYFIDITNPNSPRRIGKLPSHNNVSSLWRDIKTYNNHAFIVSEASNHGMQVFDLTRLRAYPTGSPQVTFTEDAHYGGSTVRDSHNIIINEDTGYAYILGGSTYSGGPHFVDISNPTSPVSAGGYSAYGYSHDAQVVTYNGPDTDYTGREIYIGSHGELDGNNRIVILDVTNKSSVQFISSFTYNNDRYAHQGWFTEDQRYFLFGDEEDEIGYGGGTRTIILDLSDLDNPLQHFQYSGTTNAIDHNGYVRGNRFYLSSYSAGMRVIKIDDIANQNMTEVSFFDTYVPNNTADFNGAWNVYPFFESGNMIISNYNRGFFVVKDQNYDNVPPVAVCQPFTAILDKSTGSVTIDALNIDGGSTDNIGIVSRSISGQTTFTCADVGNVYNITLTVMDDYGHTDTCVATVTIEAEDTAYNGASWSNGTPGPGSKAIINANYNTSGGGNSSIDACLCEVTTGQTLTVAAGDYLNITRDITVNGNLIVEHTANVVQTDDSASVVNNGNIDVNLTTPVLNPRDFMIMGSPMSAETNAMFSAHQVLKHTTENFTPYVGVPPVVGVNFHDQESNDWSNFAGTFNAGEGYLVRPSMTAGGTYNYTYNVGTLNNGVITYSAFFGDDKEDSPSVLSNPYASAIDADLLISSNAIIDELYFWEHLTTPASGIPGPLGANFSMEDISTRNFTMGIPASNDPGTTTTPNGVIATGQGFGIKANAAGTVTFNNALRLTSGNTTLRQSADKDLIWITVREPQYHMGSTTGIGFTENATPALDQGYDTMKLGTVVSLYSHLEDGSQQLGIQGREIFDTDITIPMGFSTQIEVDGGLPYVISIANLEGNNIENVTVYLVDHLLNISTNLSEGNYEFISDAGTFDNRFTLQFDGVLSGDSDNIEDSLRVFPNPTYGLLKVQYPNGSVEKATIFDAQGRMLVETNFELNTDGRIQNEFYSIDISALNSAVYLLQLETSNGTITKQVIKK